MYTELLKEHNKVNFNSKYENYVIFLPMPQFATGPFMSLLPLSDIEVRWHIKHDMYTICLDLLQS